jgi:hypothetical protein
LPLAPGGNGPDRLQTLPRPALARSRRDSSGKPPPTRLNPMEGHCAAGQTDAVLRVPDLDVRPILAVHGARSSRPAWSQPGHIILACRFLDTCEPPTDFGSRPGGLTGRPSAPALPPRRLSEASNRQRGRVAVMWLPIPRGWRHPRPVKPDLTSGQPCTCRSAGSACRTLRGLGYLRLITFRSYESPEWKLRRLR